MLQNHNPTAPPEQKKHEWEPKHFASFVGQNPLVRQLRVEASAAAKTIRPVRHCLFSGLAGTGKSLIARILAWESFNVPIVEVKGKGLTHLDLTAAMNSMPTDGYDAKGHLVDVENAHFPTLIIDEIDGLERGICQILHDVLAPPQNNRWSYQGITSKGVRRCWHPGCCVIGLTNFLGSLLQKDEALVSRFPIQYSFDPYETEALTLLIAQYAEQKACAIDDDAAELLASRANGVPRAAITLFQRAVDVYLSTMDAPVHIDYQTASEMLTLIEVDENGLDRSMRAYLKALVVSNGRLSIQALASVLQNDQDSLLRIVEPVLMRRGFVIRTSGGREITLAGRKALGGETGDDLNNGREIIDD